MMLIAVVLLGLAFVVIALLLASAREDGDAGMRRVQRRVVEADRDVQRSYRDARRAMNVAAGQSWRNMTD